MLLCATDRRHQKSGKLSGSCGVTYPCSQHHHKKHERETTSLESKMNRLEQPTLTDNPSNNYGTDTGYGHVSEPIIGSPGVANSKQFHSDRPSSHYHNNSSGQLIHPVGFGSVHKGKLHYKREVSKRRIQAARNRGAAGAAAAGETRPLMPDRIPADNDDDKAEGEEKEGDDDDDEDDSIKPSAYDVLWDMVFGHYVSIFLIAMPFATVANFLQWGPLWIFWLNFFTMVPLASILGDFTQEVAAHTNQVIGGLVNATFGNTVEVIVGIQALLADQFRVVQASLLGSIFSNLLLVLGSCFFFGGIREKEQTFNSTAATANMSLLALSSIALVLPTPFAQYYVVADTHVLEVSRAAAVFLMFMYLQLLYFQLRTHAYLFDDEEDDDAELSMTVAMVGLCVVTVLITFFSGYLVGSITGFVAHTGVSPTFVGLIILPIVGNAVEHVTAVTVAMKNKMDLAMGGESNPL